MTDGLNADEMQDYAWSRVQDAKQALDVHRRDGTGCCVSCGRLAPCDALLQASKMHEDYRAWLDQDGTDLQGGHESPRPRPPLLVGMGHAGNQLQ